MYRTLASVTCSKSRLFDFVIFKHTASIGNLNTSCNVNNKNNDEDDDSNVDYSFITIIVITMILITYIKCPLCVLGNQREQDKWIYNRYMCVGPKSKAFKRASCIITIQ